MHTTPWSDRNRIRRVCTAIIAAAAVGVGSLAGTSAVYADDAVVEAESSSTTAVVDDAVVNSAASHETQVAAGAAPAAATIVHTGKEYTFAPGITYYVPETVVAGSPLHISGSGWKNQAGDAGSVIGFKLDEGGVSTTLAVTNPVTGQVQGNKTIYGIVQAAANGEWEIDMPWPTLDNSNVAWSAGESHSVRMLTGSLLTGDPIRSASGTFTTVSYTPETPAETLTVPSTVVDGEDITLSGTGWLTADGSAGSVIGIKLDDGAVKTTRDVVNPANGQVTPNKTIWAIAQADANGTWTATFPFPTASNSDATWAAGETHSVQLLTGSLIVGDKKRSEGGSFTVLPKESGPACSSSDLTIVDTSAGQTATACVQQAVSTAGGSTITVSGTGWLTKDGTDGASVVLKLASRVTPSSADFQFVHTGAAGDTILNHPTNGTPDPTMWALVKADAHGAFTATFAVPTASQVPANIGAAGTLKAGSKLVVHLQSGLASTDTVHSVDSPSLVVDGTPYAGDQAGNVVECVPAGPAEAHVEAPEGTDPATGPIVNFGGTVRLVGTGWCTQDPELGGSVIGLKIDEGSFSHLAGEVVNANPQVWQVIEVDSADGSFAVDITVPNDGNGAGGTVPAFTTGTHTLRLLSGSLKKGDVTRSVQSGPFTVGHYQPNGAPDPVDSGSLTSANRNGVSAQLTATQLIVSVPGAQEGDWLFVTPFAPDGSPRYPWFGTWSQADAHGSIALPLAGATLPEGAIKVAVQSGNPGQVGTLLGWDTITVAGPSKPGEAVTGGPTPSRPTPSTPAHTPAPTLRASVFTPLVTRAAVTPAQQAAKAPESVPHAPVVGADNLTAANTGSVTGTQDGTVVTVTVPDRAPGDWVYVYAYYPQPIGVGWIQVDDNKQIRVDIAGLPSGDHKLAIVNTDGELVGWTSATVAGAEARSAVMDGGAASPEKSAVGAEGTGAAAAAPDTANSGGLSPADWWLMGGGVLVVLVAIGAAVAVKNRRNGSNGSDGGTR